VHAAGLLPGRVRLLFQPAEEVMPGGALRLMKLGALDEVASIFALHCDPTIDLGQVGLREGPITGAADALEVRLTGRGGHTSRPHLTEDLTYALSKVVTELPSVLSRRLDPRAGVSVVWGRISAGRANNVIPGTGLVGGTVRMLDAVAWSDMEQQIRTYVAEAAGVGDHVARTTGLDASPDDADSGTRVEAARQHGRQLGHELGQREREVLGQVRSAGVAAAPGQADLEAVGRAGDRPLAETDPTDVDRRVAVEGEDAAHVGQHVEVHQA
jgi:amidohydrolase